MDENMIPELTLDPAAAQAAPAPKLTLEPAATPAAPEPAKPEVKPVELDDSMLSEAEKKAVDEFAKKIDVMDSNMILQYGAAAQKNVAGFSESALASVRTKDLGDVGRSLSELVVQLKTLGRKRKRRAFLANSRRSATDWRR